jgi:hypothetical protein
MTNREFSEMKHEYDAIKKENGPRNGGAVAISLEKLENYFSIRMNMN